MTPQSINNRIAFQISDADLQAVQAALQTLQAKLVPLLVNLEPDDRRQLPKMGAKTVDFVSRTLSYTRGNPQYQPSFIDLDDFTIDLAAVGVLREIQQPLAQVADMVEDTLLLSGSEALTAALTCYQAFKGAAKANAPGAATIAADLSTRFPGRAGVKAAPVGRPAPDASPAH